jgi:para-nitrobenzyl esterase
MHRVGGLLPITSDDRDHQARVGAFRQEPQELGRSIGRNVRIDTQWPTANDDDIRRHATELTAAAPNVILAQRRAAAVNNHKKKPREAKGTMQTDTVPVQSGLLAARWNADRSVRAFKGISYARPPVGLLRWQPPQGPQAWSGVRQADAFGPRAIQPNRPSHAVGYFGLENESEDCLTLNVWTGALDPDERRPVMVWFHGGAFLVGSGSLPIFNGEALARRGVVLVTVNYRLGRLGFLAHPGLSSEQPYRASGNYGHLDQIAALHWVRSNIAAFGGDPGRVTIFGQSAGSTSVCTLMASPLAKGLFHRAIGQSGGSFFTHALPPRDEAERAGAAFARAIGANSIEELRAKPARELQLARPNENTSIEFYDSNDPKGIERATAWPIVDGYLVSERVMDTFARGGQNDVPLLTGSTRDEGSTQPPIPSLADYERRARADYGDSYADFMKVFPAGSDAEAERSSRRVVGTRIFNWENWTWANMQAATGRSSVYFYHFKHAPPKPAIGAVGDLSRDIGAFHTAEIPYVFQTLDARAWPWRDSDRRLSDTMATYWTNFAASGDPNGAGSPEWPRYSPQRDSTMIFDDDLHCGGVPDRATLDFWSAFNSRVRSTAAAA